MGNSREIARQRVLSLVDKEISDVAFEQKFGLRFHTVPEWRQGLGRTFMDILPEIADAYGVTTDWLLGHKTTATDPVSYSTVNIIGRIQAGYPIESFEGEFGTIRLPDETYPNGDLFALEVVGDSMMPIVMEGDIIICEKSEPAKANGKICVITVDGESTLKKLKVSSDGVTLIPLNPLYKEIRFTKREVVEKDFRVDGVVIESIRKF